MLGLEQGARFGFCRLYYHPLNTWTGEHFGQNSSVFAYAGEGVVVVVYNMVYYRWDHLTQCQMGWLNSLELTKGFCPYDATQKLKLGVNPNNV